MHPAPMSILTLSLMLVLGSFATAQVTSEVVVRNPAPSGYDGDSYVVSRAMSGDGRYLAYVTRLVDSSFELRLQVADLVNGTTRRLGTSLIDPDQCHLSADGRWLAIHHRDGLNLIEVSTGASRRIASGRDPRLSADGRLLAYLDDGVEDPTLRIFDRQTGVSSPLFGRNLVRLLTMSGSGQVVVFQDVNNDYVALDRRTSTLTKVGDIGVYYHPNGIGIDHAGRFIAYNADDGTGNGHVFVLDLQTGSRHQADGLTSTGTRYAQVGFDALTADGEYVVYESYDPILPSDRNGLLDVYVCRWRTGEITRRSLKSDGREAGEHARMPLIAAYDSRIVVFEAEEFVRVSNPDGSVDPEWPAASLILSGYSQRPFAAKINFQPGTAAKPALYQMDSGLVFAARGGGWSFGWRADNTRAARDRNHLRSPDQRWDTHLRMQDASNSRATWEIAVPDGWYSVRIVAGDPRYFDGRMRIGAEGVVAIDTTPGSAQPWQDRTVLTRVRDGRLTIHSMTGAVMNKLCFIEVASAAPPGETALAGFHVDFQPAGAQRVNGYAPDSGEAFARRDNGWTYGWASRNATTFERTSTRSPDQRYATGIALPTASRWELQVPNGWWAVSIACGDATASTGRHLVLAEGTPIVDGRPTSERRFVEGDGEVEVRAGRFTVQPGVGGDDVKLDFIDLVRVPMSPG